jgi:hypothetical protein
MMPVVTKFIGYIQQDIQTAQSSQTEPGNIDKAESLVFPEKPPAGKKVTFEHKRFLRVQAFTGTKKVPVCNVLIIIIVFGLRQYRCTLLIRLLSAAEPVTRAGTVCRITITATLHRQQPGRFCCYHSISCIAVWQGLVLLSRLQEEPKKVLQQAGAYTCRVFLR